MVRGYVYNADIWASVVDKNLMTNSRLVGGILTFICRTFYAESRYHSRLTGVDGSTGVWKAIRRLEINTIACSPLPRVRLPVQNLTLKFRRLKFSQFLFSYLEVKYTKISTVQKFPAIRPVYGKAKPALLWGLGKGSCHDNCSVYI